MLDDPGGRAGAVLLGIAVACAVIGPYLAPFTASEVVGRPFEQMSSAHWFGTDFLGRDVLSRILYGGRTLLVIAFVATAIAYFVGVWVAMFAGYKRGLFDQAVVGVTDVLLAFPPILFALVLLAGLGPGLGAVTLAITIVEVPRIVRIVRTATSEAASKDFVEAAVARKESVLSIMRLDILPNIWTPILADFGVRFTGAIILYASLAYLGLGPAPPSPDWGLMITENKTGLMFQPWPVVAPAVAIAILAIGANLVTDAVGRVASVSFREGREADDG